MVLFGSDKITIKLDKFDYKPGDIINGDIFLNLKKPIQARKLSVSLIGKRKSTHYSIGSRKTSYYTFYDLDIPVGGDKEYQNEEVPFQIKIPSDILYSETARDKITDELTEKIGSFGSVIGAMTLGASHITWEVRAQLDVPMKFDLRKSQDIVISDK